MKIAMVILAATAAAGCAVPMPAGYVEVPEALDYEWRGISAEGVVIGLRIRDNEPEGTIDFWSTVMRRELEGQRGYTMTGSKDVPAGTLTGSALHFTVPGAIPKAYWIALFSTRGRFLVFTWPTITTFEIGGPREAVEKDLPALKAFLLKLKL